MSTKHDRMTQRIEEHGRQLLAIFPDATQRDPVKLCKRLRQLEGQADRASVAYCNGEIQDRTFERTTDAVRGKANAMLSTDRVWINSDPRGYALKIDLEPGEVLHRDWGGYGIIAPDLSAD